MTKRVLFLISSVAVLCALSACSGGRVKTLDARTKNTESSIDDIRTLQAQQTATLEEIRVEMRELSGRVEELQYRVTGKTKELEQSLANFSTRVPPPPGVPEDILAEDEKAIGQTTGEAANSFRIGLSQIRAGNFNGARHTFINFVDMNPDTTFSDNALFWVGISFNQMAQHDRAIVAYSDVFQRYPAEDRVDDSLYFLAESFAKIKSYSDAKVTMQKLVGEHPKSKYTKDARKKIREYGRKKKR